MLLGYEAKHWLWGCLAINDEAPIIVMKIEIQKPWFPKILFRFLCFSWFVFWILFCCRAIFYDLFVFVFFVFNMFATLFFTFFFFFDALEKWCLLNFYFVDIFYNNPGRTNCILITLMSTTKYEFCILLFVFNLRSLYHLSVYLFVSLCSFLFLYRFLNVYI